MISVSDTFHGVTVSESYRWLEEWDDPKVKEWSNAQNALTRHYLDNLPDLPAIQRRLEEIEGGATIDYSGLKPAGGRLFAKKKQPPLDQPLLVVMPSANFPEQENVIVDLNKLADDGSIAMDFYVPSHDGKLVAVCLSHHGSERGDLHIYRTDDGTALDDVVTRTNGPTAGGDVAWLPDNSGFFYARYPHEGERPEEDLDFYQQIYFHKLGTPNSEDTYILGKDFPRIAEIELEASDDGSLFLAAVANGDGGEFAHYLRLPSGEWKQVTHHRDGIPSVVFAPDNSLWMVSYANTMRGRILRLAPGKTSLATARLIVPESDATIKSFLPTRRLLYVIDMIGGPRRVRIFNHKGEAQEAMPFPPMSSVWSLLPTGDDDILLQFGTYLRPTAWYRYSPYGPEYERTQLYETIPVEFADIEVVREAATSKDGTLIPINIMKPRGIELDGTNPTILYGYGGYGISQSPSCRASRRLWFDQGGVYVVANIRGGGEFGEGWHRMGNLTRKQNVFDDFIACAEYLIDEGYTNPSKLAIEGGSNGGLLMGAALTQRPELFRAVSSRAGIYDMLRVELDPNGEFNVTEFGTVNDPDQFAALYAYSPYHRVVDGTAYPAVMFTTGEHDGRVNPNQSRKMTARLQAATSSGYPILLRTSSSSGHGQGTSLSESIATQADVYAFLLDQLGLTFKPGQQSTE
ncbi:MAG: prolyl oligopeptidase family serine peptidase [candidate division Zixibacteria bacterium]|nr:prolyl oligopeptidase family serine peptidase [candidate division Zixibacteria bacterium]